MVTRKIAVAAAGTAVLAGALGVGVWAAGHDPSPRVAATRSAVSAAPWPGMMGRRTGGYPTMGPGMMGDRWWGPGMMGNSPYWLAGDGTPVRSPAAARARATLFADRLGLRVGEVMQFTDNYYAELATASGQSATEVLIDPVGGAVGLEYGPAMMWNTVYGMHPGQTRKARISPRQAAQIAQRWLQGRGTTLAAGEPETFPGYYTLHTLAAGKLSGMLSVNATTGAVWDHTWHGTYITTNRH